MSMIDKNIEVLEVFDGLEGFITPQVNDQVMDECYIFTNSFDDIELCVWGDTSGFKEGQKVNITLMQKIGRSLKMIEFKAIKIAYIYECDKYPSDNRLVFYIDISKRPIHIFDFELAIREE